MDEAEAKENQPVTLSARRSRVSQVVGSGSTWGAKERDKFRIQTADAVDVSEFIGDEWFDFDNLDKSQREGNTPISSPDFSNGISSIRTHVSI